MQYKNKQPDNMRIDLTETIYKIAHGQQEQQDDDDRC